MKIIDIKKESWPACVFIGKQGTNWGEWWSNGWFAPLEAQPALPENGDAYIGAVRIVDGVPQRWIGMFFPEGTPAPEGYEAVDIPAKNYAVCYLKDKEGSGDFHTQETHEASLAALKQQDYTRSEGDWCFERCNCPRFTTPDAEGMVILDYGIAIE